MSVLRLLAALYVRAGNRLTAIRCLERMASANSRYRLSQVQEDLAHLARLREPC